MNRLSRRLALSTVLVLAVSGVTSCNFVRPPALTMARDSSSEPFFTFSADELFTELNKNNGEQNGTTSLAPLVESQRVAELLTGKVRPRILEQLLADRGVKATDADRAAVERAAQQQQLPPSEDEMAFQTNLVALANALAGEFLAKPGTNVDEYARGYYEERKATFAQPAQTCLHVVTVDAPTDPVTDPAAQPRPPSDAQIDSVQAAAQAMRQRLNTEPFETVHQSTGRTAAQIPGGDLGCRTDEELPPQLVQGLANVPVGTISQPIRWQMGWVIARVDDRRVARTPPFEEVRQEALAAARQTLGGRFVTEALEGAYKRYAIRVDPRFGRWDPERGQVLTPEGAAPAPTAPTTTTTPTLLGDGPGSAPAPTTSAPAGAR